MQIVCLKGNGRKDRAGLQCGTAGVAVWYGRGYSAARQGLQCGTAGVTVWYGRGCSVARQGLQCGTVGVAVWHGRGCSVVRQGLQYEWPPDFILWPWRRPWRFTACIPRRQHRAVQSSSGSRISTVCSLSRGQAKVYHIEGPSLYMIYLWVRHQLINPSPTPPAPNQIQYTHFIGKTKHRHTHVHMTWQH